MKKIYLSFIAVLLVALTAVSCQQDDGLKVNVGYLRIEVGTNAYVDTRSVPEDYNPKQIALQILNSSNEVVEGTTASSDTGNIHHQSIVQRVRRF